MPVFYFYISIEYSNYCGMLGNFKESGGIPIRLIALIFSMLVMALLLLNYKTKLSPDLLSSPDGLLLSKSDRKSIWEAEQKGNILSSVAFKEFSSAFSKGNSVKLKKFLGSEFAGNLLVDGTRFQSSSKKFEASRETGNTEFKNISSSELVDWLINLKNQYNGSPSVNFSLMKIHPQERTDSKGKWTGEGKFIINGPGEGGSLQEHRIFFDWTCNQLTEKALKRDGWLSGLKITRLEHSRSDDSLFKEVSKERGLDTASFHNNWDLEPDKMIANSGGVYVTDFNRDGNLDLCLTDILHPSKFILYKGEKGKFLDVTQELGLASSFAGLVVFVDLDGDGWEDLIHQWNNSRFGIRVMRNVKGEKFVDATHLTNLPEIISAAGGNNTPTGYSIADFDLDGNVDLYLTRSAGMSFKSGSWIDGKSGAVSNNQLLRNLGGANFEDVTQKHQADGGRRSTAGAVWIHANDDLYPDLYLIDEFGNGQLLANKNGLLSPFKIIDRPSDWGSMGVTAGDFNNDGISDIYVNNMYSKAGKRVMANLPDGVYDQETQQKLNNLVDGSELYVGLGGWEYRPTGKNMHVDAVGWSWGPSMADFNNDGWPDIYATAGYISVDRSKPDG